MADEMKGRVVAITGANAGIGRATAEALARMGARVLACGRNAQKLDAAVADIKAKTGNDGVEALVADLASLKDVARLADRIGERAAVLDVLINNAGLTVDRRIDSADGYELTFAVNHLAPFVLTNRLLPRLERAKGRVVTVSSAMHARIKALDVAALADPPTVDWARTYGASKLCNILFTRALARRCEGAVTANCLHPGVIATEIGDGGDLSGLTAVAWRVAKWFMPGPEKGARTSVHLASSPAVGEVSGAYFVNRSVARTSRLAQDDALAEALWAESERLAVAALGDGALRGA